MTPKQQERWDEVLTKARIDGRRFVRAGVQVILAVEADRAALLYQLHDAVKDAGWHPGRTDHDLFEIIRAKGKELTGALADRAALLEALKAILADGVHCDVVPHLHRKAREAIARVEGK